MNVRPVLAALAALIAGIAAAPWLSMPSAFPLTAMALCALAGVLLYRRPRWMAAALLASLFLFGLWKAGMAATPLPGDVSRCIGEPSVWVLGHVASEVEPAPGGRRFTLAVRAVHDYAATQPAGGQMLITARAARGFAYGDEVWVRGRVSAPPGATNPGSFDYAAWLARRGIFSTLIARRAGDVRPTGRASGSPAARLAGLLRRAVQRASAHRLPADEAALLDGLLLSIRTRLPADVEDAFARTGTVHVLSTSGLHLALLAGFLWWLSRTLTVPRRPANLLILAIVWVYALAAGGGPAVTRSALMLSVVLAAPLVRRNADPINTLAVAAVVLLLVSPLALYDAGTQLSFCTVATLIAWMPPLTRLLLPWEPGLDRPGRAARGTVLAFLVGLVAQAGSWPLVAYHFNLFSPIAPLANVPIAALTGVLLIGGLVGVPLAAAPLVGGLAYAVLGAGLRLLRLLAVGFAALPWAAVSAASPPPLFVLLYYLALWGAAPLVHAHVLRKTLFAPAPAGPADADDGLVGVAAPRAG